MALALLLFFNIKENFLENIENSVATYKIFIIYSLKYFLYSEKNKICCNIMLLILNYYCSKMLPWKYSDLF